MRIISELAKREGRFLESALPVMAFVTLTTVRQFSQAKWDDRFALWVRGLQAHNHMTLGWIKAHETTPQRHAHVALVGAGPLDCRHAEKLWQAIAAPRYADAAVVKPYQLGRGGLGYILKELGIAPEDAQFSPNLSAFALHSSSQFYGRNPAEKRQRVRIKEQLKRQRAEQHLLVG